MGVKGLLKELLPATTSAHLTHYRGKAVVIDGSSWLYKVGVCVCVFFSVRET